VEFDSLPEKALVEIDGQRRSSGNYNLEPSVEHTIVVKRGGEEVARQDVTPSPGQVVKVAIRRERPGVKSSGPARPVAKQGSATLVVNSSPSTTVFLGRSALGSSPVNTEVEAGSHTLRLVNRSLMINYTERLNLRPGQRVQRDITLGQGKVRVSARPYADVSINGVNLGQTPILKTLYAGTYTVVLTNDKLGKRERRVVKLRQGGDERVAVDWR